MSEAREIGAASGALRRDEAAAFLAISPARLDALRKDGKIAAVQVGGGKDRPRVVYTLDELEDAPRELHWIFTAGMSDGEVDAALAEFGVVGGEHQAASRMASACA